MEEYPLELRTSPVPLVALVGCAELHSHVTKHLHSQQPPMNTLALPDFTRIDAISKAQKGDTALSDQSYGILKSDWIRKHCTRVPAVVAAFFSLDQVSGNPTRWLQVCTDLDHLKAVLRGRNIKLVIVVAELSTLKDEICEDYTLSLSKRADLDSKYIITFLLNHPVEMKESLDRLGTIFAELANMYYRVEGRMVKQRLERKRLCSVELTIRHFFKIAVYAELRRNLAEALRMYKGAYQKLREMIRSTTLSTAIQWLIEIKTVAEQLHFKVVTLLLHGGKLTEAITWFRHHRASYKSVLGAPEVRFLHWEWLSRQFLVFAELLESEVSCTQSISSPIPGTLNNLTELEFQSSYYYQVAVSYLKERRFCLERTLSMMETTNKSDNDVESIMPSTYIGQYARIIEEGDTCSLKRITDEEYIRYALTAEKKRSHGFTLQIINILKRCFEAYTDLKSPRLASYCGFEIAKEYYAIGEFHRAKEHLDTIAIHYRKEGWVILLWVVLGYLRECSRKVGSTKDFVEYSLEMAALSMSSSSGIQKLSFGPAGPPSLSQREVIQEEVFQLVRGEICQNNDLKISDVQPIHLVNDLSSPLSMVLLASFAFHKQLVKPGAPTPMTVSLLSQLPLPLEIDQLDIQFNKPTCNFSIINGHKSDIPTLDGQPNARIETTPSLRLSTNKWLRLSYDIESDLSGRLECLSITARSGPYFTICCIAESPASMIGLPLWKFEDQLVESSSIIDQADSLSGQRFIQVEKPDPLVDLKLDAPSPALVGERFPVSVTISSKGGPEAFSGELKINLVDVRGGGGLSSPREVEPSSSNGGGLSSPGEVEPSSSVDDLYVELLGVSGLENVDNILKIGSRFGLVSVPYVIEGASWSCKLEIRWSRSKPIMLYVSLGYSPLDSDHGAPKVHIHRNLEIEGKIAFTISHRFMLPFRRHPLLLSPLKSIVTFPQNETGVLLITAKNCMEVPLQLLSMSVDGDDDISNLAFYKGEVFEKIFTVVPELNLPKVVTLRWKREESSSSSVVTTKHTLPDINVEAPPLIVEMICPAHFIMGNPFAYIIRVKNQTQLLQEIKYTLADSQSFLVSGANNDTLLMMPKSEYDLSYKLVPLISGFQELPRFTATSLRYSVEFQWSNTSAFVFVFPNVPHFLKEEEGKQQLVAAVD